MFFFIITCFMVNFKKMSFCFIIHESNTEPKQTGTQKSKFEPNHGKVNHRGKPHSFNWMASLRMRNGSVLHSYDHGCNIKPGVLGSQHLSL